MAHDTTLNPGSGGDVIATYDLAVGGAYPTTGKVPTGVLYVGALPAPVSVTNPLPITGAVTQSGGPWTVNATQVGGAALALGQTTMAASVPVTLASNQSALAVSQSGAWSIGLNAGSNTIGAVTQANGPWTINVTQIGGAALALGQTTMTASVPVTIASNQSVLSVQGDSASGAAKAGNPVQIGGVFNTTQPTVTTGQTVEQQSTARGALIVATGADTLNATINAALPAGTNTIGAVTQASGPWTVNATQIGGVALALGQTTMAASMPVVVASNQSALLIQGDSASGAVKAGNPVQIGGVFNTTQPTVTTGQTVEGQSTARGAAIVATGVDTFNVTVNAALPAGTNTIGAVTQASGPWTINATQVGGAALALGQTTMAASLPVTIASNQSALSIQGDSASGAAKAGNPVQIGGVFNTTQPTVTTGQTVELQSTARGAAIVATGADTFNVAVNAALPAGTNTLGAVTQASGPWTVNVTQVSGAALVLGQAVMAASVPVTLASNQSVLSVQGDSASGAAKAGNPVQIGGVFNTTQPTVTTGQTVEQQSTARGAVIVATGVDTFNVTVNTPLPAGTNTIGAVTQASGPWTANVTQVGGTGLALGQATMAASVPVVLASNQSAVIIQGGAASGSAKAGNPAQVGGVFNTTQPTVTTGQVVESQATARGAMIVASGVDVFNVTVNTALPAGTNTLGAVTQASGPWTANITQVGGTALALGQTTMAASLPVTLASNQSVLSIQGDSASGAAKAGNPIQIGGVFNTTQPTVTTGQTVESQSTARGGLIVATGADVFNVTVNTALAAGTNTIGGVTLPDLEVGLAIGTAPAKMLVTGGQYNSAAFAMTNTQTVAIQLNSGGALFTTRENRVNTFNGSSALITLASSPTEVAHLTGSSTKVVKLKKLIVRVFSTNGTPTAFPVVLYLQSTVSTGGTVGSMSTSNRDHTNGAGQTASAVFYTANPTGIGTEVAIIDELYIHPRSLTALATDSDTDGEYVWDFSDDDGENYVLHGVADNIAVNFNGSTIAATATASIRMVWTEE